MKKRFISLLLIAVLSFPLFVGAEETADNTEANSIVFNDVAESHYAYDAIMYLRMQEFFCLGLNFDIAKKIGFDLTSIERCRGGVYRRRCVG